MTYCANQLQNKAKMIGDILQKNLMEEIQGNAEKDGNII